jgi:hypothetical protein
MTDKDPFNFDLRVSTDKKKRRSGRRGMSGAFETSQRVCEHDGCEEPGQYRAPKSPTIWRISSGSAAITCASTI